MDFRLSDRKIGLRLKIRKVRKHEIKPQINDLKAENNLRICGNFIEPKMEMRLSA